MENRTLFWDADTQYDFLAPEGKLYMPGAERIISVISDVRAVALDNGCSIIASQDWHSLENPEISASPDYEQTYPPHCIAGTPGAERIGYLGHLPIDYVGLEPRNPGELEELVRKKQFHIVIRKKAISVFSNPNTVPLLEAASPGRIIVFGVALDICVADTLRDLARFSDIELVLIRDATVPLDPESEEKVLDEMQSLGVDITESRMLREMVPCG